MVNFEIILQKILSFFQTEKINTDFLIFSTSPDSNDFIF
jgi:hypothetical protein